MIESYTRMLRNYMVLRGRTTRYDFWSFVLVQCVITIVALILSGVVHDAVGILLALYFFATIMPALGGIVRRLHDTGRGFWWLPLGIGLGPIAFVCQGWSENEAVSEGKRGGSIRATSNNGQTFRVDWFVGEGCARELLAQRASHTHR